MDDRRLLADAASLLLPFGSLGDILGRRRVFAGGLSLFTLGSLLCALSTSGTELIVFRIVQGIGGAAIFATSLALLAQTFQGRERGFALGIWGAVVGCRRWRRAAAGRPADDRSELALDLLREPADRRVRRRRDADARAGVQAAASRGASTFPALPYSRPVCSSWSTD